MEIIIRVTDANDNAPVFEELDRYEVRVKEDSPTNVALFKVCEISKLQFFFSYLFKYIRYPLKIEKLTSVFLKMSLDV